MPTPGFNAVRLPFSFRDLHDLLPRSWTTDAPRPSDAQVAASTLPPGWNSKTWQLSDGTV